MATAPKSKKSTAISFRDSADNFIGFLGYTTYVEKSLTPAPPPANLRDPAKIAEATASRKQEALELSKSMPTAAAIASWALVSLSGEMLMDRDIAGLSPGRSLIKTLVDQGYFLPSLIFPVIPSREPKTFVVGFNVHAGVRIAAAEAIRARDFTPMSLYRHDPARDPRAADPLFDPYVALFHTEARKYVSILGALNYFCDGWPVASDEALLNDPRSSAEAARQLCIQAGFFIGE